MLKKLVCLLSFCVVVVSFNAIAASNVGLLGKNRPSINVARTVAITPQNQSIIKQSSAKTEQKLGTSNLKADSSNSSAKMPTVFKLKHSGNVPATNNNTNTNTNGSGISENDFNSLVQRVEVLESKDTNAITDIVEDGTGTYINDIQKDDNKLNVSKTNLLYVPIKNASGGAVSGNAEIWIIK